MMKMLTGRWSRILLKLVVYAGAGTVMLQLSPDPVPAQQAPTASAPRTAAASTFEAAPASAPDVLTRASPTLASAQAPASSTPRLEGIEVTSELDIPHWLRPGEFAWNDEGVPAGPTIVVVNIRARVLSVYRGGVEIGRSSLIYGADNKPTPTGTFPILQKRVHHVSNLYDAPMPHMQRLTWDGVAIHGTDQLGDALATRGCVGLPREFAELLYGATKVGDKVVIWSGERTA